MHHNSDWVYNSYAIFTNETREKEIPTLNTSPINDSNLNLYMGDKKAKNEIFLH